MGVGLASLSLKTLSIRAISVEVVSMPQKAAQSFTTIPAAITLLPLFTVPVWNTITTCYHVANHSVQKVVYIIYLTASGTCRRDDNSSCSWIGMFGCTKPPWLDKMEYEPTRTLLAIVCLNTSTFRVSAKISSVSFNERHKSRTCLKYFSIMNFLV